MDRRSDPSDERIGEVLAERYRITAALGRGGMGTVYRAEHVHIKREVAIKLLRPELNAHPEVNERFKREAFATGRVDHPNCVSITDSGVLDDGSTYLVTELLEGVSLADELDRLGRLPPRRALRIARHVLRGLGHAHAAGIIHRDLKPENVFLVAGVDDPDFAKILDFGIAKLVGDALDAAGGNELTQAGIAVGSPTYMSPEQATGEPIDGRSDLYSLTVMLYELLAGRRPFEADNKLDVLRMHLGVEPPTLGAHAPDVATPTLEAIMARGLQKRPDARFRDADEYLAAVDQAIVEVEQRPPPPTPRELAPTAQLPPPPPPAAVPRSTAPLQANATSSATTAAAGAPPVVATPPPLAPPPPAPPSLASTPPGQTPITSARPAMPPAGPRRWPWLAAGSALVLAIAIAIVVDARSGSSPDTGKTTGTSSPPARAARDEPRRPQRSATADDLPAPTDDSDPLQTVDQMLANGRDRDAEDVLVALRRDRPNDARVAFRLGKLYFDRNWWKDGFEHYTAAVELDPEYRTNEQIISDAIRSLESRSQNWRGRDFLVNHVGAPAIPHLRATLDRWKNPTHRRRVEEVIRRIQRKTQD